MSGSRRTSRAFLLAFLLFPPLAIGCTEEEGSSSCGALCQCVVEYAGHESRDTCLNRCGEGLASPDPEQYCRGELSSRGLDVCQAHCPSTNDAVGSEGATGGASGPPAASGLGDAGQFPGVTGGDQVSGAGGPADAGPRRDAGPDAGTSGGPDAGGADACRACLEAECIDEIEACVADEACMALNECIAECTDGDDVDPCIDDCAQRYATGAQSLLSVYECRNDACPVCLAPGE
ncbi:hypothetical protein L6V77_11750 [Myxococcota bacterium]|nr:hypothetical protein [Myxococcota bacterium]